MDTTQTPSASRLVNLDSTNTCGEWIVANWVKYHVCGNKEYFTEMKKLAVSERKPVYPDQKTAVYPIAIGTVVLEAKSNGKWAKLTLTNVLYVPGSPNLFSEVQIAKNSYELDIDKRLFKNTDNKRQNLKFRENSDKFVMKFRPFCNYTSNKKIKLETLFHPNELAWISHLRACHSKLEGSVSFNIDCKWCIGVPQNTKLEIETDNDLVPGDVILAYVLDKISMPFGSHHICVLLKDKATHYCWAILAKNADDLGKKIEIFFKKLEKSYKLKIKLIEFTTVTDLIIRNKIKKVAIRNKTSVSLPQLDNLDSGVVDPSFSQVLEKLTLILGATQFSLKLWEQALQTSVYFTNITPVTEVYRSSPYESLKNVKPRLDHLKIIGSSAIPFGEKKKMKDKNWILIGYTKNDEYLLYNKISEELYETSRAIFFEEEQFLKFKNNYSNYEPTAPTANVITNENVDSLAKFSDTNTHHQKLRSKHLTFIFNQLKVANFCNKQSLSDILEPFKMGLIDFENAAKAVTPYEHTSSYPRSSTFDSYELKAKGEFEPLKTTGDGNCLYYAISIALFGNEKNADILRLILLRHVLQNWDVLKENCSMIFGKKFEGLVKSIVQLNSWGSGSDMFLFSEILSAPIYVLDFSKTTLQIRTLVYNSNPDNVTRQPIYILLHENHFESLRPKPYKIITSITLENAINFFVCVTHKYVYNGNMNVITRFNEHETATRLYPDLKDEFEVLGKSTPETITLTDDDNDGSVDSRKGCPKCIKKNKRIDELYATNADLRRDLRKKFSIDTHKNKLPLLPCDSCAELSKKFQLIVTQKQQLKDQFNRRGEALVQKIAMLNHELTQLGRRNQDLVEGNNVVVGTLAKANEEKAILERDIVTLAQALEKYRDFDNYRTQLTDFWTNKPSITSPIMTPGRDIPELNKPRESKKIKTENSTVCILNPTRSGNNISSTGNTVSSQQTQIQMFPMIMDTDENQKMIVSNDVKQEDVKASISRRSSLDLVKELHDYLREHPMDPNSQRPNILDDDLRVTPSDCSERVQYDSRKQSKLQKSDDSYDDNETKIDSFCSRKSDSSEGVVEYNSRKKSRIYVCEHSDEDADIEKSCGRESDSSEGVVEYNSRKKSRIYVNEDSDEDTDIEKSCDRESDSSEAGEEYNLRSNSACGTRPNLDSNRRSRSHSSSDTSWDSNSRIPSSSQSESDSRHSEDECKIPSRKTFKIPKLQNTSKCCKSKSSTHDGSVPAAADKNISTCHQTSCSMSSAHHAECHNQEKLTSVKGQEDPLCSTQTGQMVSRTRLFTLPYRFGGKNSTEELKSFSVDVLHVVNDSDTSQKRSCDKPKIHQKDAELPSKSKSKAPLVYNFHCPECPKSYTAKNSLQRHMETHAEFRVPCRLCDKTFSCHENMMKHARNIHSRPESFKCQFCDHTLKSKKAIETHEKSKHFEKYTEFQQKSNKHGK